MLSVAARFSTMSGTTVDNPIIEEILEDGEIEDEDESDGEVVAAENETPVLVEQNGQGVPHDSQSKTGTGLDQDSHGYSDTPELKHSMRENLENDYGDVHDASSMTPEDKKHKKHQRKRKRHKDSKEKEIRSLEKKERRRKRKMHAAAEDGVSVEPVHGGSTSPHSRKKRKRKKHSTHHRDSSSPDSNASDENQASRVPPTGQDSQYYTGEGQYDMTEVADYDNEYDQTDMYSTATSRKSYTNSSNNNSGSYYTSSTTRAGYQDSTGYQEEYADDDDYESRSESGSDFESQLAEYKSYKTQKTNDDTDEYYSNESGRRRRGARYSSPLSSSRRPPTRKRGQMMGGKATAQRSQRMRRPRWENKPATGKISSEEKEVQPARRERKVEERSSHHYSNYNDYNESPRRLCKFYAEGSCAKGNDCNFSHDLAAQARQGSYRSQQMTKQYNQNQHVRTRKRELCKFYLAGHCHHGDNCTYMHSEYPCKYHHTGATCYAGDNCRFSHAPETEETKEIIENLNDVYSNVDDSWEIEELAKAGMKALDKPPPGVGLLPTPTIPPVKAQTGGIPSLFDIQVAPSADLQRRIDENSVASLSMTDDSEEMSEVGMEQQQVYNHYKKTSVVPNINMNIHKQGLLPTPAAAPLKQAQHDIDRDDEDGFYDNYYESEHHMEVAGDNEGNSHLDGKKTNTDDDILKTDEEDFIRIDTGHSTADENHDVDVKAPDFLPATQKALFMRIHQKRTSADGDKNLDESKSKKDKDADAWTYSSEDEDKPTSSVPGIIKMDSDVPATKSTSASVESILQMITSKKGDSSTTVDTNLLSKVASVINMASASGSTTAHYDPATNAATYNPAQAKVSPHHSSSNQNSHHGHRDRKTSISSSTSPGHSKHGHHNPHPLRRRLSTQELSKEPMVIPLMAKQTGSLMHSAHPDPRLTLSRLIGVKALPYNANLPRFSKDLILPGSGKMVGLKITVSSDDSKTTKRDPRLGRHKDPRLQKSSDPRLKNRPTGKPIDITSTNDTASRTPTLPTKPSALITKSSGVIPSLPELDLDLAHINNRSKESNIALPASSPPSTKATASYSLPQHLKLPRLMKAPVVQTEVLNPSTSPPSETIVPPPTIAPYDPRYMSSGPAKPAPSLTRSTAPYDPRITSGNSSLPLGDLKKRTIQLPKLTPAPTYKSIIDGAESSGLMGEKPEGDQGDF